MADTCSTCRYYIVEAQSVTCRRYPPHPFVIPASTLQPAIVVPVWPNPGAAQYCGEWRSSEATIGGVLKFPIPTTITPEG